MERLRGYGGVENGFYPLGTKLQSSIPGVMKLSLEGEILNREG